MCSISGIRASGLVRLVSPRSALRRPGPAHRSTTAISAGQLDRPGRSAPRKAARHCGRHSAAAGLLPGAASPASCWAVWSGAATAGGDDGGRRTAGPRVWPGKSDPGVLTDGFAAQSWSSSVQALHRPLEDVHRLAERLGRSGQPLGSEQHHQHDHQDDDVPGGKCIAHLSPHSAEPVLLVIDTRSLHARSMQTGERIGGPAAKCPVR